jgi:hypothetical protein
MEMPLAYDVLYDSVSDIEHQLYNSRKNFKKLQKKFNALQKLHNKCRNETIYLHR